MGPDSKVIITGDQSQIDLPKKQTSGLIEAMNVLKNIKGVGFVELDEGDVVRHRLVKEIIKAYMASHPEQQQNGASRSAMESTDGGRVARCRAPTPTARHGAA